MLPERFRELLTAYVDGELSARQRRHMLRLLRRSPEARRLLQRLQSDSDALIHLPRVRPDRDLSEPILQQIAASRPLPMRPARRRAPVRAYPAWAGVAAAAAVLFLVGTASYWFFASSLDRPAPPLAFAANQPSRPADAPNGTRPADGPQNIAAPPRHDDSHGGNPAPAPHAPTDDVAHQKPSDTNVPTPEKEEPIFTSEGMEMFNELKSVLPSTDVPTTFKLRDLDQDAVRKKLVAELQKDALRVELPIPDANRAFERLQSVFKTHHVDLAIDATAQRRLAKQWRTNYVLYSEDLTADELAHLLQQLGADDRKAAEKKPADGLFDGLVVRRMTERDHKELADLLGADATPVAPPKDPGPLGVDPRKPVSDRTGDQVAAALGQGKPGAKAAAEHPMLVLPYNPVRPRHDSAEIKRFLDERKPLRPGAVPVLLVLRGPTK